MKRLPIILLSLVLLACVPTPEEEFVVYRGDGKLEETIRETAAPDVTAAPVEFPARWTDRIEQQYVTVEIDAAVQMNDGAHPIRKVTRHRFTGEDVQRIASAMLPAVNAVSRSVAYSRQEYEEALASLSELGLESVAKSVYREMTEENPPDEQWEDTDRIAICNGAVELTYRCDNGRCATIISHNGSRTTLQIDTARRAIPYGADILSSDGYIVGQGPMEVTPSITEEQAEVLAADFLDRAGISGYRVYRSEPAAYCGLLNGVCYSQGWSLTLVNACEYLPFDFDDGGMVDGMFRTEGDDLFSAPWHTETMHLYVSDLGVESFFWAEPTEVTEIVNPDVPLMDFESVTKQMKKLLGAGLGWMAKYKGDYPDTPKVTQLLLSQTLVPVRDEPGAAYLMPTWVVVTDWYSTFLGEVEFTGFTCFNAVDGSPISVDPERD